MNRTDHSGESGMALIMVLGVLSVTMVMIAHIMLMVRMLTGQSYQIAREASLRYDAESAADVAMWYHFTDRRLFSDRALGKSLDNTSRADYSLEPWMLDGTPHWFNDAQTVVYLNNGDSGVRIDSLNALRNGYDAVDDADFLDGINDFIAAYDDYIDTNDEVRIGGYEHDDYARDGFPTLPRNGGMQFKAELYWLPDWRNVLTSQLCVVPPRGVSYKFQSRKPSLFSASAAEIARYLNYDESSLEVSAILDALRRWRNDGTALDESLDLDLLTQLRSHFDFNEGGIALCHAESYDANREVHAVYRVIREARMNTRSVFADRKGECLSIWERLRE